MIRPILCFILSFSPFLGSSQCGKEHPSGFRHYNEFVFNGDTLNRKDSEGLYHGIHVYSDNSDMAFTDTNTYLKGRFIHGLPVGEWIDHCYDGSYSLGQYNVSFGVTWIDSTGQQQSKLMGIYAKVGVWRFFDKNNKLLKTLRYDRSQLKNGHENKIYQLDSLGNFILIERVFKRNYSKKKRKTIEEIYSAGGKKVYKEFFSLWRDVTIEYHPNGEKSMVEKRRRIFGKYRTSSVIKHFNEEGKLTCKETNRCPRPYRKPKQDLYTPSW